MMLTHLLTWLNGEPNDGSRRPTSRMYNQPLPLEIFPLPAFVPSNPLSYIRIVCAYSTSTLSGLAPHRTLLRGYYSPATRSVHVTDADAVHALWHMGFFGKGSLSRSEPEWMALERRRALFRQSDGTSSTPGGTAGEITNRRRQERREGKRLRAQREREELENQLRVEGKLDQRGFDGIPNEHPQQLPSPGSNAQPHPIYQASHLSKQGGQHLKGVSQLSEITSNQEHLQLTPEETFFLVHALGCLEVFSSPTRAAERLRTRELFELFCKTSLFPPLPNGMLAPPPEEGFMTRYVAYHHFRSLGWVVRPGIKFAVDFLLYARGPVFSHAEFAVIVLPCQSQDALQSCAQPIPKQSLAWQERREWWFIHAVNRVQNQVLKTLVIAFVEVPPMISIGEYNMSNLLERCSVREFVVRRWTPNRNRG